MTTKTSDHCHKEFWPFLQHVVVLYFEGTIVRMDAVAKSIIKF